MRDHCHEPAGEDNTGRTMEGAITADGIYKIVKHYAKRVGVDIEGLGAHSLRATAATNALDHEADIPKVQEWLLTSPPPGSMIGGRPGRRTARRRAAFSCTDSR
jgi:integrase